MDSTKRLLSPISRADQPLSKKRNTTTGDVGFELSSCIVSIQHNNLPQRKLGPNPRVYARPDISLLCLQFKTRVSVSKVEAVVQNLIKVATVKDRKQEQFVIGSRGVEYQLNEYRCTRVKLIQELHVTYSTIFVDNYLFERELKEIIDVCKNGFSALTNSDLHSMLTFSRSVMAVFIQTCYNNRKQNHDIKGRIIVIRNYLSSCKTLSEIQYNRLTPCQKEKAEDRYARFMELLSKNQTHGVITEQESQVLSMYMEYYKYYPGFKQNLRHSIYRSIL